MNMKRRSKFINNTLQCRQIKKDNIRENDRRQNVLLKRFSLIGIFAKKFYKSRELLIELEKKLVEIHYHGNFVFTSFNAAYHYSAKNE